jgi:peptidoglycan/LPS O-acetylase OafA/YrhL
MDAGLHQRPTAPLSPPSAVSTGAGAFSVDAASASGHLPGLDGLRGVAVLLVMGVHLAMVDGSTLADRLFLFAAFMGWTGVDLFFVLSGFLITGILYDAKNSPHYFRNFYMRRGLRIFPLYYTLVFIVLLVVPQVLAAAPSPWTLHVSYWLYLSKFMVILGLAGGGPLGVTWSLAIEEQFYLLWAPIVHRLHRGALVRLCIALIVVAVVLRVVLLIAGVHPVVLYMLPFTRMDALAIGALLAISMRSTGGGVALSRMARRVGPIAVLAVLGVIVWDMDSTWRGTAMQTIGYTCIAIMFGCLLVLTIAPDSRWVGPLMANRHLRMFGKYSYALYLLHLPIRAFIRDYVYGPRELHTLFGSQLPGQVLFYAAGVCAALAAAWCSWHLFEKRFLRLKRYFPMEPVRPLERDARSV